jgi:hypothetical protein
MWALLFLLRHVRELPTPEEQKKLGLDPTPQMPYPPYFGQQGHHHRGR